MFHCSVSGETFTAFLDSDLKKPTRICGRLIQGEANRSLLPSRDPGSLQTIELRSNRGDRRLAVRIQARALRD